MMVIGKRIKKNEMEFIIILMEVYMKENGKMIKKKEMVPLLMLKKEYGKIMNIKTIKFYLRVNYYLNNFII